MIALWPKNYFKWINFSFLRKESSFKTDMNIDNGLTVHTKDQRFSHFFQICQKSHFFRKMFENI